MFNLKIENIFLIVLLAFTALYLTWHMGRLYEHNIYKSVIANNSDNSVYTDYVIPSGRYQGEYAIGNCMINREYEILLDYAGLDY